MIDPELTEVDNVYAHLTMLTVTMEILMAHGMVSVSPEQAEAVRAEFSRKMRSATLPPGADPDAALRLCKRAADLGDAFMARVAKREAHLRGNSG